MFDGEDGDDLGGVVDRIQNAIVADAETVEASEVAFEGFDVGMAARILLKMLEASGDFFGGGAIELEVEGLGDRVQDDFKHRRAGLASF